jgi:DNA repair exonuclease SbcCD ATPase subunit
LAGSGEIANLHVPHQMVASSSESTFGELQTHPLNKLEIVQDDDYQDKSVPAIKTRETLKSWNADTELTLEDASLVVIDDMVESHNKIGDGSSHNESDRATSEPGEGEHEKEGENDSIAYTSMEKEFRKLIQENKDLLNTKNALNVVKDDLIAEVDRLTNEVSMYEQAVEQLNSTKDQMKQKVAALDAELRKTKEELEKAKQKIREVSIHAWKTVKSKISMFKGHMY